MCGRYASFQSNQSLMDAFLIDSALPLDAEVAAWRASWNIAPTQGVRIVVERAPESVIEAGDDAEAPLSPQDAVDSSKTPTAQPGDSGSTSAPPHPGRSLRVARWGLVPSWADSPAIGARMINARAETVAEKPSYRRAFAARRAIIPADGYYEWSPHHLVGGKKVPYFIHASDVGSGLAFAGLYEFWRDPARAVDDPNRWLTTATIITTAASGSLGEIHDREPVALAPDMWDRWLDPATDTAEASEILRAPRTDLAWYSIGMDVNKPSNNSAALLTPQAFPEGGGISGEGTGG